MDPDEQSKLEAKPELRKDWTCQECMPREGTNKLVEDEVEGIYLKVQQTLNLVKVQIKI